MSSGNPADRRAADAGHEPPSPSSLVQRWSTRAVVPNERLDYFAAALSEAVIPFSVDHADPHTFASDLSVSKLGAIEISKTCGSAHRSFRGPGELARTDRHMINLLMTLDGTWETTHRGTMKLRAGDILFHDTHFPIETMVRQRFTAINVAVTEQWLKRWVPNPGAFVGRFVSAQSVWGRALSSYIAELSPDLVDRPPLPFSVMSDLVGSLVALAAFQFGCQIPPHTPASKSIRERFNEILMQRCTEPRLCAADIAASMNVSPRTLHRALAAAGETLGGRLIDARVAVAVRMLSSPLFKRTTTAEIGHRAGFVSGSHFARVVRQRTGLTPLQLRRAKQ